MDFLGYAALGGLERLTIVAGAVVIGYWGYRLYTSEKNVGLIFMGLAAVVLVGALITGGSYLRSVGEGYQLASLPAEAPAGDSPFAEDSGPASADTPFVPEPPVSPAVAPLAVSDPAGEPAIEFTADAEAEQTAAAPAPERTTDVPALATAELAATEAAESPARLATGAELGGRIMSVKSENVSLEWSPASQDSGSGSE